MHSHLIIKLVSNMLEQDYRTEAKERNLSCAPPLAEKSAICSPPHPPGPPPAEKARAAQDELAR